MWWGRRVGNNFCRALSVPGAVESLRMSKKVTVPVFEKQGPAWGRPRVLKPRAKRARGVVHPL